MNEVSPSMHVKTYIRWPLGNHVFILQVAGCSDSLSIMNGSAAALLTGFQMNLQGEEIDMRGS